MKNFILFLLILFYFTSVSCQSSIDEKLLEDVDKTSTIHVENYRKLEREYRTMLEDIASGARVFTKEERKEVEKNRLKLSENPDVEVPASLLKICNDIADKADNMYAFKDRQVFLETQFQSYLNADLKPQEKKAILTFLTLHKVNTAFINEYTSAQQSVNRNTNMRISRMNAECAGGIIGIAIGARLFLVLILLVGQA